jgi:hypothetical protein
VGRAELGCGVAVGRVDPVGRTVDLLARELTDVLG